MKEEEAYFNAIDHLCDLPQEVIASYSLVEIMDLVDKFSVAAITAYSMYGTENNELLHSWQQVSEALAGRAPDWGLIAIILRKEADILLDIDQEDRAVSSLFLGSGMSLNYLADRLVELTNE